MNLEHEQETLEALLDGALSAEETRLVNERLAIEPELDAALADVREQRSLRQAVWQSLEPDDAAAGRFADAIIRHARRQRLLDAMGRVSRMAISAAACLFLGVATGWYLWGRSTQPAGQVARANSPNSDTHLVGSPGSTGAGVYQVAITDGDGNVIALQKFNQLDEARAFAEDLGRYEERRADVQDGKATLVSDRF